MKISGSDEAVLTAVGAAIARARLQGNQTQVELAREAGVSRATIHRLEGGQSTQLVNLIRILRALGLDGILGQLAAVAPVRPLQQLREERGSGTRKRARRSSSEQGSDPKRGPRPWTWGDE